MLTSFIRTLILLVAVIVAVRLMGKRQIGQLQPAELVVTILLSQIAATPMQDNDIPMMNTLVAVMVLVGVENRKTLGLAKLCCHSENINKVLFRQYS